MALNPLQERIALLAADLASAHGFALVGGAALNILEVVDRRTQDLDYFHPLHDTAVARYGNALEDLLRQAGLDVAAIRRTDSFRRYHVSDGRWSTDVDLALDPQLYPAVATSYGPVLGLPELGVNKLLAAFSCYEPRDLIDLAAITRRVPFADSSSSLHAMTPASTPRCLRTPCGLPPRFHSPSGASIRPHTSASSQRYKTGSRPSSQRNGGSTNQTPALELGL